VQAAAETQETAWSSFTPRLWGAALGLGTLAQVEPFQDKIRVLGPIPMLESLPTAVQSLTETQETPSRLLINRGLGLGTIDQVVPFQDSMSVLDGLFVL